MLYRLRFIVLIFRCLISQPKGLLEDFDLYFIAVPLIDTDITRMFTQTYAAYMGLARWHYIFASHFKKAAIRDHWAPVATTERIQYKRSIKAGEKVQLRTKMLCWDEKRFFLRQTFLVNGEERAFALVEGLVRGSTGVLKPTEAFKALGVSSPSPEMPEEIKQFRGIYSQNGSK
jgi:acyl-CoA thioesterase FadM